MVIHFGNTELEVKAEDNSYRLRAVKGVDKLVLYYSLTHHVEIPLGAWVEYEGQAFTLLKASNFTKNSTRNFSYTLTLEYDWARSGLYKCKNPVDGRLKFAYTAKPHEFIQLLVDNMNLRESGWTVGECIEAAEQVVSFNHVYCSDALNMIADAFETEWEVIGKTINLRKVEYFKDNPLPLSYGRGNGFKTEISRSNQSGQQAVEILYVQGGTDNIDPSKYGNSELLLPKNQELVYEGCNYISSADGLYIRRKDKELVSRCEDSLDCSAIYPKRVGSVSSVVVVDANRHFYDFIDTSIPNELDFADCLIAGETMTVIFQTGMLAGKELEVKYKHNERRFEIVPQDIDGQTMPNDIFKPVIGDKYAVFHIALPNAYVCNNSDKSGASWDMFRDAARYLYEHEGNLFTFKGVLDGIWAKKDWLNIGGRIRIGAYVMFSDEQFNPEGSLIRIVSVKDYCNNPHSPIIELSNAPVTSSFQNAMNKVVESEVVIDNKHRDAIQFTKRRYRDSQETIEMLREAMLDNFTESISPIAVQTMAMLIGDKSLQFEFVRGIADRTPVSHNVSYNQTTKVLSVPFGVIQHYTLGIDTISSSHDSDEYMWWLLPNFNTPPLTDGDKKFYLYAKVSTTNQTGQFYISEKAIAIEEVPGYYHLLMGVLNSEFNGERSYVSLYGFSEVLPGQVITNRVASANGKNFMDFLNNAFRIGNDKTYIDWNASVANVLSMKNATVQIANSAGQTMIYFSGVDGSGQLAKGNITWDKYGNLKAHSGTFENVIIKGAIRTPFQDGYFRLDGEGEGITVSTLGLQNNNCVVIPGEARGVYTAFTMPFAAEYNGFRACILNTKWGNQNAVGQISASAPSGYYFHEDGERLSDLTINPNEGVDIIGVGEGNSFKGWLVLNRFRYGVANSGEGFPLKAVFAGKVEFSGGKPHLVKEKRYNQYWYGAENSGCQLSYMFNAPHYCTIRFPTGTFSSADNYTVLLSGELLRSDNGPGVYASVIKRTAYSFTVYTGDDAYWNDGNFTFIVIATHLWD